MLYTESNRFDSLDRMVLEGENTYKKYFAYMKTVFEKVLSAYHLDAEGKQDEVALLQYFLGLLLNSINCLEMKYRFDTQFQLKVDQSDSSYPNAYEFQTLQDDINCQKEKLMEMQPKELLLKELIQSIYAQKEDLSTIQHALALRAYNEAISDRKSFFLPLTRGQLSLLSREGKRNQYMYTYGIFEDTLSIPMVFQLIFETTKEYKEGVTDSLFEEFLMDIKYASENLNLLLDVATHLNNRTSSDIYPKSLKRMIIGPLYGKYSASSTELGTFLYNLQSDDVFALEVQIESLVSKGETQSSSGKKPTQNFAFGKTPETILRKVTESRVLLFAPHDVGRKLLSEQSLRSDMRKLTLVSLQNQKI